MTAYSTVRCDGLSTGTRHRCVKELQVPANGRQLAAKPVRDMLKQYGWRRVTVKRITHVTYPNGRSGDTVSSDIRDYCSLHVGQIPKPADRTTRMPDLVWDAEAGRYKEAQQ